MNSINVFLDDYRTCPENHILVENIDDCLYLLATRRVQHLSLDHDLTSKTRNGLLLVTIMVDRQLFPERITIHSANASGSRAMYNHLKEAQQSNSMPFHIKISLRPLPLR